MSERWSLAFVHTPIADSTVFQSWSIPGCSRSIGSCGARGYTIPPDVFAAHYRVAARYIGLRYMWWTLEYWLSDPRRQPGYSTTSG